MLPESLWTVKTQRSSKTYCCSQQPGGMLHGGLLHVVEPERLSPCSAAFTYMESGKALLVSEAGSISTQLQNHLN